MPPPVASFRPLTAGLRRLLAVASGLVFLAGVPLFVGTEQTDRYFAWTVKPALTAAFLGASYWSSFFLEFLVSRERVWARGRVAVPGVLVFTTLTLIGTMVHRDRFHFNSPLVIARAVTWFWLAIYAIVPPAMFVLFARQLVIPGSDPPRREPLPRWIRWIVGAEAAVMLPIGAVLFLAPQWAGRVWPWMLTPLTGRAVGAWLVGLGLVTARVIWEADFGRVRPVMITATIFGVLQFVALMRYPGDMQWRSPAALAYLLLLLSFLAVGTTGWRRPLRTEE